MAIDMEMMLNGLKMEFETRIDDIVRAEQGQKTELSGVWMAIDVTIDRQAEIAYQLKMLAAENPAVSHYLYQFAETLESLNFSLKDANQVVSSIVNRW